MGTIDVWAQIMTERMAKQPWLQTVMRWTGQAGEHFLPSVESTLHAMDEAGVDISLLSAWYGPEGDLISNEEVAHQIQAAPTRFRGLKQFSAYLNRWDSQQARNEGVFAH
jgi:uncharacterized protein